MLAHRQTVAGRIGMGLGVLVIAGSVSGGVALAADLDWRNGEESVVPVSNEGEAASGRDHSDGGDVDSDPDSDGSEVSAAVDECDGDSDRHDDRNEDDARDDHDDDIDDHDRDDDDDHNQD